MDEDAATDDDIMEEQTLADDDPHIDELEDNSDNSNDDIDVPDDE